MDSKRLPRIYIYYNFTVLLELLRNPSVRTGTEKFPIK